MNKRKKVFIGLGSIILIFTLFVGSYVIRQNQQQGILTVSEIENSEDIIETDTPTVDGYVTEAEYGTMVGNSSETVEELPGVEDVENVEDVADYGEEGDGSGIYGEPAAKLDPAYETAMENSDLAPFEKELIRLIVEKEGKSFEEALQSVRPGARVVEQGETETSSGNQNTEKPSNNNNGNNSKPTTPTKPPKQDNTTPKTNEGDSGGADFNNPDTRTPEQKEADANDPFSGGVYQGGPGGDVSHAPDF